MLSIIIPTKNEEDYIGYLLKDLTLQNFPYKMEIIISDNKSSDNTINIVESFKDKLNIKIIKGGLPAEARNNGYYESNYSTLLFMDADVRIFDKFLLRDSLNIFLNKKVDLVTCYLNSHFFKSKLIYMLSNIACLFSKYFLKPYSTTMFFMINKDIFHKRGMFNEEYKHCEDVMLSKEIENKKFKIIRKFIYTDNRRMKKTGYLNFIVYFIKNIIHLNNPDYFKKDIGYWS